MVHVQLQPTQTNIVSSFVLLTQGFHVKPSVTSAYDAQHFFVMLLLLFPRVNYSAHFFLLLLSSDML